MHPEYLYSNTTHPPIHHCKGKHRGVCLSVPGLISSYQHSYFLPQRSNIAVAPVITSFQRQMLCIMLRHLLHLVTKTDLTSMYSTTCLHLQCQCVPESRKYHPPGQPNSCMMTNQAFAQAGLEHGSACAWTRQIGQNSFGACKEKFKLLQALNMWRT